ncbi:hypothetical protein PC118_g6301 [Phytophthora cactorum]|uniref:Uncharacterized protein n=1 Tax=Phytophthora cactorum TaxID=29920 RepID=A0A8T1G9V1_9STRA|nr:hypothetical protein PC118_g6301 [Phytophthora cactorum]
MSNSRLAFFRALLASLPYFQDAVASKTDRLWILFWKGLTVMRLMRSAAAFAILIEGCWIHTNKRRIRI